MFNRRTFLKTAAAAGAGLMIPARSQAGWAVPGYRDVVVIGGGLAGLAAARFLQQSGVNSLLVLDARDQSGGRILNQRFLDGTVVEGGAEWIGPTQEKLVALVQTLGLQVFPTHDAGAGLLALGAKVIGTDEQAGGAGAEEFAALQAELDALSETVPLDEPWTAPGARQLDLQTLADWLQAHGASRTVRLLFDKVTGSTLGEPASKISLLHFLFYMHSGGGISQRIGVAGAAQGLRIAGGPQQITSRMADPLADRIHLAAPVSEVTVRGGLVVVRHARGETACRQVVVAMMPADMRRIRFSPALPPRRAGLIARWPTAKIIKINIRYASPFWRSKGLSGQVSALGTIYSVFDNSPPGGTPGVLEAFAKSGLLPAGRRERIITVLRTLAAYFGPEALRCNGYLEKDWADERWISGCVSPLGPGFTTTYGPALRAPVGPIHWASAETAAIWNGKMEGAYRAGEAAAQAVLGRL